MTPGDVARVLSACALYDYRTIEAHDVAAWYEVLGDLDANDTLEAVKRHYRDSTDRAMPAHLRARVKEIRAERRRQQPHEARALPSRFETDDMGRRVRLERGAATARQVLGPLVEHLAAQRDELPAAAMRELRAITAGPGWVADGDADTDHDGEASA